MKTRKINGFTNILLLSSLPVLINMSYALDAKHTGVAPKIDGVMDTLWQTAPWQPIDQHILGEMPSKEDFFGRFKVIWDENKIYLLAEIQDDILFDSHPDPLDAYWDDDCLEIFIDEDRSGGEHQFNFNAFAYHIALDNQVVDIGYKTKDGLADFMLFNDHLSSAWRRQSEQPNRLIWEVALDVYDDSFSYTTNKANVKEFNQAQPVKLSANKTLGFMLAYCDNDGSESREHFIGSVAIEPKNGDKNLGYKDASVFAPLKLIHE
ncbi:MAG: sugar-binding protein [Cognaticolwellia sp.]